jgi:hypothetical protein
MGLLPKAPRISEGEMLATVSAGAFVLWLPSRYPRVKATITNADTPVISQVRCEMPVIESPFRKSE